MRILWVTPGFLHPTNRGGQIRTLEMLRRLHACHEVHYVAFNNRAQPEGLQRAHEYCSQAYPLPLDVPLRRSPKFAIQLLGNFFSSMPLSLSRYHSAAMREKITELRNASPFDSVVCDFLTPAPSFVDMSKVVLFQHNVETMIWRRHVEQSPDPVRKTYFKIQANRMFDWERRMCQAAGRVVAVSPQDAATMQAMFAIDAVSVPTGVDLDYFRRPPDPQRTADLVFVGSMDWLPNSDGVNYFVRDVLPLIWQRKKDCTLAVVGRNPSPAMLARAREDSRIQVTGTVPDVRPWLWGASVSIVPLRIGGGTRLKIYEAMAAGTATVSTSIGAEGLDVAHPANIRLADTSRNFAEECLTLLQDASQRQAMAAHALELVTSRFSWDVVTAEFEKLLVVGARPAQRLRDRLRLDDVTMDEKRQKPTIAVFGLGYVGCVTAACFAELEFRVVGVDIDARKVRAIRDGQSPFYEPGLEPLIAKHLSSGSLTATPSAQEALRDADFAFLCVGTPSAPNGNLNLDYLRKVATEIGSHLDGRAKPLTIVVRSTVFPGTCDEVVAPSVEPRATVVANPEFLREGSAVKDFMEPSLVVVGSHNRAAAEGVASLYAGLPVQTSVVALRTAELIKYTCNTFHALKIAFANEIGTLSTSLGLDGAEVMETICRDTKLNISSVYMKPGFAFGGSCLPKDLRGLTYRARQLDLDLPLLNSVLPSNEAHITRAFRRVMEMGCRKIGIYGLAFKPNTDDLRESPGVALIERLIGKGCDVKIYDPHIQLDAIYGSNEAFLLKALPHIGRSMEKSLQGVISWAELIVVTQQPNAEAQQALSHSPVPVINVASSEGITAPKLEPVR